MTSGEVYTHLIFAIAVLTCLVTMHGKKMVVTPNSLVGFALSLVAAYLMYLYPIEWGTYGDRETM